MKKKPGKKSAVSPPDAAPKTSGASLAKKDANSAPALPEDFETTMGRLLRLCSPSPETLDTARLKAVMVRCFVMLKKTSRVEGGKAKEAAIALLQATVLGCRYLEDVSSHEKSRQVIKWLASETTEWPVLLSLYPSAHDAANDYFRRISLGAASTSPPDKINDSHEQRYRKRADDLIQKIRAYQKLLNLEPQMQSENYKSSSRDDQKSTDVLLMEAKEWEKKFPGMRCLPPQEWWDVAKEMFKADWDADPEAAKAFFGFVNKITLVNKITDDGKTAKTVAIRSLKRVFDNKVVKGFLGTDSVP